VSLREPQGPGFENSGQLAVFSWQCSVGSGFESLSHREHFENLNVAPQPPERYGFYKKKEVVKKSIGLVQVLHRLDR